MDTGTCFNVKTVFPLGGISIIMIRRSWDCLIFKMGIPLLTGQNLYRDSPLDNSTPIRLGCFNECQQCNFFWPGRQQGFFACEATYKWRHNGCDGIPNHQPHDCLLNRLFRRGSMKTSKLRVTDLCAGNSPLTGEFPAQMARNAENASTWWCHHAYGKTDHEDTLVTECTTTTKLCPYFMRPTTYAWPGPT